MKRSAAKREPSLFGDPPEPEKKKARKKADKPKKPEADVTRLFRIYDEEFVRCFPGTKPLHLQGGREAKHLKDLSVAMGAEETEQLIRDFFSSRDYKVVSSNYSIADIYRLAQYLRLSSHRAALQDPRMAGNIDAAARAVRRR